MKYDVTVSLPQLPHQPWGKTFYCILSYKTLEPNVLMVGASVESLRRDFDENYRFVWRNTLYKLKNVEDIMKMTPGTWFYGRKNRRYLMCRCDYLTYKVIRDINPGPRYRYRHINFIIEEDDEGLYVRYVSRTTTRLKYD